MGVATMAVAIIEIYVLAGRPYQEERCPGSVQGLGTLPGDNVPLSGGCFSFITCFGSWNGLKQTAIWICFFCQLFVSGLRFKSSQRNVVSSRWAIPDRALSLHKGSKPEASRLKEVAGWRHEDVPS